MDQHRNLNACFNLLTKNLSNHPLSCPVCQTCSHIYTSLTSLLHSLNIQGPNNLLSSFLDQDVNSAFTSNLASKFFTHSKCQCGSESSSPSQSLFNLNIPILTKPTSIQDLIKSSNRQITTNSCIKPNCPIKLSTSSVKLEVTSKNFLFSLNWESQDLKSLTNFILGLRGVLEFGDLFEDNSRVYLQGMILSNKSTTVYIKLSPCFVYIDWQKSTEIYIDYFLFALIQYSMFPVVLIYSYDECESGLDEKIGVYREKIFSYLRFLDGDLPIEEGICFYCWFSDHSMCQEISSRDFWTCECSRVNSAFCLFCLTCARPIHVFPAEIKKTCLFCDETIKSPYCPKCSFVAECSDCARYIYKTQPLACSTCGTLLTSQTSKTCPSCNRIPIKLRCLDCHSAQRSQLCLHSSQQNCSSCLYDYTCGVCFKPQQVFEFKYCWACLSKLVDGLCLNCKQYPASNSWVCRACVDSNKKCDYKHVITLQSIEYCDKCNQKSKIFCKKCTKLTHECTNRVFCIECATDVQNIENFCLACLGNEGNHNCAKTRICKMCFDRIKTCECGGFLRHSEKVCKLCGRNSGGFNQIAEVVWDGQGCRACGFRIEQTVIFCENCNLSQEDFVDREKCKICKKVCAGKYCESCYKQGNCSTCLKDMLISQRLYCLKCNSQIYNRFCGICREIVPLSEVQCYLCSQSNWRCMNNHSNPSKNSRCYLCYSPNIFPCHICNSLSIMPLYSFRSQIDQSILPLQNDLKCCRNCSLALQSCTCGAKYLHYESVCKICSNILPNK